MNKVVGIGVTVLAVGSIAIGALILAGTVAASLSLGISAVALGAIALFAVAYSLHTHQDKSVSIREPSHISAALPSRPQREREEEEEYVPELDLLSFGPSSSAAEAAAAGAILNRRFRPAASSSAAVAAKNDDYAAVMAAVKQDGMALEYASDRLQDDYDIVMAAVKQEGYALQFASDRLKDNYDIVMAAASQNFYAQRYASPRLQNDATIYHSAHRRVSNMNSLEPSLKGASAARRNNPAFVISIIQHCPLEFRYASDIIRDDLDIAIAAVQRHQGNLQHVSPRLQQDPDFQRVIHILTARTLRDAYIVDLTELQAAPLKILGDLSLYKSLPKIRYKDSPGIDAGGLQKDMVTRLMQALYHPKAPQFPTRQDDGGLIPLMKSPKQSKEYQNLGAFFALVLDSQAVTIGTYFHPLFFEMLHALSRQDVLNARSIQTFDAIPPATVDKLFRIYYKDSYTQAQVDAICKDAVPQELSDALDLNDEQGASRPATKKDFLDELLFQETALACFHIAAGAYNTVASFDKLKGNSANALSLTLQGSLDDNEAVFDAIRWEERTGTDPLKNEATKAYFIWWLAHASPAEVTNLLWAVTGSTTLRPGSKLSFGFYSHADRLPSYHTCFNSMDLPNGYPDYNTFKQKLDESITWALGAQSGMQLS